MADDPTQDKDFLAASPSDQHAYLMATDHEYAHASPQDQHAYLDHISTQGRTFQAERANAPKTTTEALTRAVKAPFTRDFWKQAGEAGKGLVGGLLDMPTNPAQAAIAGGKLGAQIGSEDTARKQEGRSLPYRGVAALGTAIGVPARQMEEQAERGSPEGIMGAAAPAAAMTVAPLVGEGAGALRRSIGASKTLESIPTRSIGDAIEQPSKLPAYVARKVFPEPAERVAARQPLQSTLDERMTQAEQARQKELGAKARMGREETKQHGKFADTVEETEAARQKELAANERLKTMHGNELMKRGAEQEALDRESIGSKIAMPEAGPATGPAIESEGSPARWTNQRVLELAAKGNRAAITQVGVRQLPMPPNARYIMGDIDYRNQITSPREVTKFTPEGQPIRQEVPEPIGPNVDRIARAAQEGPPRPEPESIGPQIGRLNFEQAHEVPSEQPIEPQAEAVGESIQPSEESEMERARRGPPVREPLGEPIVPEEAAEPAEIKGLTEPIGEKIRPQRPEKPVPIEKRFGPDEIADAEGLLASEAGAMGSADRPGAYFDENPDNEFTSQRQQNSAKGVTSGGKWRGVRSGRDMFPFMKEHPEWGPEAVQKALRNKDSAAYRKMMEAAIEFVNRGKSIEVDERSAIQGEGLMNAPEATRSSASPTPPPSERWTADRGAIPGEATLFLDGDPETAKAAIIERGDPHQPGYSRYELASEGKTLGIYGTAEEAASAGERLFPPEKEGVLPGMGQHIQAQEEGAARLRSEGLVHEMNTPEDISERVGELETKSPLFRGTAASPQREIFGESIGTPIGESDLEAARRGAGGINPAERSIRRKFEKRRKQ